MPEIVSRRKILRACRSHGWTVQTTALGAMHKYLNQFDKDVLEDVLSEMSQRLDKQTKLISESLWEETMNPSHSTGEIDAVRDLVLVNSFDCPRLCYDTMRKTFHVEERKWSLLGSVADKVSTCVLREAIHNNYN